MTLSKELNRAGGGSHVGPLGKGVQAEDRAIVKPCHESRTAGCPSARRPVRQEQSWGGVGKSR